MLIKKSSNKKLWGARGIKILCLSSMAVVLLGSPAFSQAPVYSTNSPSAQATAQMEIRLQQMETQIRDLTGRVESQVYEMNQLKNQIKTLESMKLESAQAETRARGSGQIAVPERDPMAPVQNNPLNLDIKPPAIAGMKTSVPGGGNTDATALYEQAFANVKSQNYDKAEDGFKTFLEGHSDHVLAANAKYWLGETYYVRGDYKKSARTFAEGFQAYPESAKAPDILLKLGMSLAGMGKEKEACVALSQVAIKFPVGNDPVLQRTEQEMDKLGCDT